MVQGSPVWLRRRVRQDRRREQVKRSSSHKMATYTVEIEYLTREKEPEYFVEHGVAGPRPNETVEALAGRFLEACRQYNRVPEGTLARVVAPHRGEMLELDQESWTAPCSVALDATLSTVMIAITDQEMTRHIRSCLDTFVRVWQQSHA
ncbi:hypothetical protein KFL_006800090 [Klebsormidium nitens]|uniref:Uncharacterized protein n=1 Tax=Klebsormidium nitens TaxID=105231 RepID=A0A1Y1IIX9_KLENI|nr:hypothetical protein KFL_006800090 [Klebsormidium nitens]|eukprot:GAQ90754.1 hypothetical protein KFL_006800090 [Klebsormidium nitens]